MKKKNALGAEAPQRAKASLSISPQTRRHAARAGTNVAVADRAVSLHVAANVPAELRADRVWLLWRYGPPNKQGKRPKVPHYLDGAKRAGRQGTQSDLARLASFDDVITKLAAGGWDGIGMAMLGGFVAGDLDRKADTVDPLSDDEVAELCAGTYYERSPGGVGWRAFWRGDMERISGGARGVEIFPHGQFVTVTGNVAPGAADALSELTEATKARLRLLAALETERVTEIDDGQRASKEPRGYDTATTRDLLAHLPPEWCREYSHWLCAGMALHHEFHGHSDALALWDEWSQQESSKYEAGACGAKWQTFGEPGKEAVTMGTLIRAAQENGWRAPPTIEQAMREFAPVVPEVHEADADDDLLVSLPRLPDSALYGVLLNIVEAATANSEATRPGVAASVLAHFAARFGAALALEIGDERRTLPAYMLLVGPTGRGRKGTSSQLAQHLFDALDLRMESGWGDDLLASGHPYVPKLRPITGLSSGQGVIELVRDPGFYVSRGVEKYVPGVEDKRLLIDLSEFAQVFVVSAQDGSTLSMVLRDAFDGRKLQSPSRSNPVTATEAHICFLGHITMTEFKRRTVGDKRSTEVDNGLLNRFCILYSARERIVRRPTPVPEPVRRKLVDTLALNVRAVFEQVEADHRSRRAHVMRLTDDAAALWDVEYPKLTTERYDNDTVAALMGRREVITMTVAALLAAMNGETAIGVEALRAALAWGQYVARTNTQVFTTLAQRRQAAKLRADIAKVREAMVAKGGSITKRELLQKFSGTKLDSTSQEAALRAMLEAAPPDIVFDGKAYILQTSA